LLLVCLFDRARVVGQHRFTVVCNEWQIVIGPAKAVMACIPAIASGVLSGLRHHQSVELRSQRFVRKQEVFEQVNDVRFISVLRNTAYKFSGTNKDAIFGPRIAAETCGKKDDVNSSACQAVTCRRSARPE
jgi:hypothetical protein